MGWNNGTMLLPVVPAVKNPQSIDNQGFFGVERVGTMIFRFVSKFLEVLLAIGTIWKQPKMGAMHCSKRVFFETIVPPLSPLIFLCFF